MSALTHCTATPASRLSRFAWVDAALVCGATLLAAALFVRFEFMETIFDSTRAWEHLQIDELPATLLVLAAGLAWFGWRRYRETKRELIAREAAEARLASLLKDHRRLTQQYVDLQESERKALARELHDELGQYLNAMKTDAVTIQRHATRDAPVQRAASAIVAHCDHVQETVRALIGRLRPIGLDVLGLRAALEHYFALVRETTPQRTLSVRLEGELDDLDDAVSLTIYRLIQEGLTNVSRHAGARSVSVSVMRVHERSSSDRVAIGVVDDGRGADPTAKTLGLGVLGMRERVEALGGELEIRTAPGAGFSILANLPVRSQQPSYRAGEPQHGLASTDHSLVNTL